LQGLKLQIYRLRRPELLSWVPLIPLQKLPVRFSPGGLEKIAHILEIFFFDILLPLLYIRLILKQVLIISVQALFAISKGITLQHFIQRKPAANSQAPANPSTLECSEGLAEVEN
jgi:hypothetical protein